MGTFLLDIRFAAHSFRKSPGLTAAIVISLALGIGANTAMFSVVYSVLLKPLPYPDADRLAVIWSYDPRGETAGATGADFVYWKEHAHAFENLAAWTYRAASWQTSGTPRPFTSILATPNFFDTVGVNPSSATYFPDEQAPEVAVISHKCWTQSLGGDSNILGHILTLDHVSYTIIGVMPKVTISCPSSRMRGYPWRSTSTSAFTTTCSSQRGFKRVRRSSRQLQSSRG